MKKSRLLLVVLMVCVFALSFCLASCTGTGITNAINVNRTEATIEKGSAISLTAEVNSVSEEIPVLTWTSSDTSIVTVEAGPDGLVCEVTAVAVGSAIVTVSYNDMSAAVTITVVDTAVELAAAKDAKIAALDTLLARYPSTNYTASAYTNMQAMIEAEKNIVNGYTTVAQVEAYTTTAVAARLDAVVTVAQQLDADKAAKVAELDALAAQYKEADYSAENWAALSAYITAAKTSVGQCTTSEAVAAIVVNNVKTQCDEVLPLAKTQYTVTLTVNNADYGYTTVTSLKVLYGRSIYATNALLTAGIYSASAIPTMLDGYTTVLVSWSGIPESGIVVSDLTVTANFARTPNTYTLTFNADGGVGIGEANATKDVVFDTTYGELPVVTRTGYTFDGWYIGETKLDAEADVKVLSNSTVVAKWIANKYTLTFDFNGASGPVDFSKEVTFGAAYGNLPANPTITGRSFIGWYVDGQAITSTTLVAITKDSIAIAHWDKYEISFDTNGGTFEDTTPRIVTVGEAYGTLPGTPNRAGYEFGGWYVGETKIDAESLVNLYKDTIAVARWNEIYTIEYRETKDAENTNVTQYTVETEDFELTELEVFGFNFDGWYDADGKKVEEIWQGTTGNIVLTARWSPMTFELSFFLNGGTGTAETMTVAYGEPYGELPQVTYPGNDFVGWRVGTDIVTSEDIVNITANTRAQAVWSPKTFTVSFDKDGGTGTADSIQITFGARWSNLPVVAKDGFVFVGWFIDGVVIVNDTVARIVSDSTAVARWTDSLVLTFNANEGQTTERQKTVYVGETYGELPEATREGYTFDGWYIGEGEDAVKIVATDPVAIEANTTVTAKWTANKYTLSFDLNEGTGTAEPKDVTYGAAYGALPAEPTREGYKFGGWYIGETRIETTTVVAITENTTAVALWYKIHTVTYIDEMNASNSNPTTFTADQASVSLQQLEKGGYTFLGWYEGDMLFMQIASGTDRDLTLTARWAIATYTLTFNYDGGFGAMSQMEVVFNETYGMLPTASRLGYTFVGWFVGETEIREGDTVAITANATATAKWTANQYKITFNADGGSCSVVARVYTNGETYGELPTPTREGYQFDGWYVLNSRITATSTVALSYDTEAVARWTRINSITYLNTKDAQNTNPTTYTVLTRDYVLTNLVKEGWTFNGWFDEDGQWVTTILTTSTGDIVLTAKWTANTYTVLFVPGEGMSIPVRVTYDSAYGTLPADPTREGYTFAGWYLGDTQITETSIVAVTENNVEIKAKWTANKYRLNFDKNGGTGTTAEMLVTYGAAYGTLPTIAKAGSEFLGWFVGDDEITETTIVGLTADTTAVARWSIYTIYFEYAGGTGSVGAIEVKNGEVYGTLPTATRTGYDFGGWFIGEDQITAETVAQLESNVTATARWLLAYTITYTDEQNADNSNPTTYNVDTTFELVAPEKDGYVFAGWYEDADFTGDAVTEIAIGTTGNKTFYAKWTYQISYTLNGGENAESNPATFFSIDEAITLAAATREGYTFDGWYDNAEFEGEVVTTIAQGSKENVALFAKFTANKYTLTFDADGGEGTVEPKEVTYDAAYGALPTVSKEYYSFDGWFIGEGEDAVKITATDTVKILADTAATARWTLDEFTITYTLNGGENAESNPATYLSIGETITLAEATREGYTFDGWYDNAEFEGEVVTTIAQGSTGDKALFAKFTANKYTLTFNADGGEGETAEMTVTYGAAYGTLPTVTKANYKFDGWFIGEGEDAVKITATDIVKILANTTATAKWTADEYTITYNLGGGVNAESNPTKYTVETETITLAEATKEGYAFDGWYGDAEFGGEAITTIAQGSTGNRTLYAKWVEGSFTVSFDLDGGEGTAEPKQVTYNATYGTLPTDPTREGYVFDGWYLGTTKITAESKVEITEDTVLKAKWNGNTITLSFDPANGDETNPADQNVTCGATYGTLPTVTMAGYDFVGWFIGEGEDAVEITAASTVEIIANATATARWTPAKYTVTFNADGGVGTATTIEVTFGETYGTLPTATKAYYTFDGWFIGEGEDAVEITAESTVEITKNTTLKAKWTAVKYTLTFDADGGEVTEATKEVSFGEKYGELPTPTKTGNIFVGWFINGVEIVGGTWIGETQIKADDTVNIVEDATATAKWISLVKLTFDAKGGECDTTEMTVTYNAPYGTLPTPTKEGYTFDGWFIGEGEAEVEITAESTVEITADTTATAKWTVVKSVLTFNADGGEGLDEDNTTKEVTYGEVYGTLPTVTKVNAVFDGWYIGETKIDAETIVSITANATATARWTVIYTITYTETKGATNSNPTTYSAKTGEIILMSITAEGYDFDGWYIGEDRVTSIAATTTGDIELEARWTAIESRLSFDLNGGTGSVNVVTVTYGEVYGTLPTPTRAHAVFDGWYIGETKIDAESIVAITADSIAVARWDMNEYKLSFDANEGTCATETKEVTYSEAYGELPTPTRVGHTFAGWFIGEGEAEVEITAESTVEITADTTATAKWTLAKYTLTFDANEGTCPTATKEVTYSEAYGTLPTPTRVGHTFAGWFIGETEITATTIVAITADTTATASWTAIEYTVTFKNGTETVLTKTDYHYGDTIVLPETNPTKATDDKYIYTFDGWKNYVDGMTVTGDVTFEAEYATAENKAEAKIGTTYYDTLADAIADLQDGETIVLLRDTAYELVVAQSKELVLDLNGKTLTGNIINAGTLTINGDGTVVTEEKEHLINNSGTLTINGGIFSAPIASGFAVINNNGTEAKQAVLTIKGGTFAFAGRTPNAATLVAGWYLIFNGQYGTIADISGGEFDQRGVSASLIDNVGTITNISGGNFVSNFCIIKNEPAGVITAITDGTFDLNAYDAGGRDALLINYGTIGDIKGGDFTVTYYIKPSSANSVVYNTNGTMKISNGNFRVLFAEEDYAYVHYVIWNYADASTTATLNITGGNFYAAQTTWNPTYVLQAKGATGALLNTTVSGGNFYNKAIYAASSQYKIVLTGGRVFAVVIANVDMTGHALLYDGELFAVVPSEGVEAKAAAQIGTKYYDDAADAFATVTASSTVVLFKDSDVDVVLGHAAFGAMTNSEGATFTISLLNGAKYTGTISSANEQFEVVKLTDTNDELTYTIRIKEEHAGISVTTSEGQTAYYSTLQKLNLSFAQTANAQVKVLKDQDVNEGTSSTIKLNYPMTIDLNGKKIIVSSTTTAAAIEIKANGVVIKNGTIEAAAKNTVISSGIYTLELSGVNIIAKSTIISVGANGVVDLSACSFSVEDSTKIVLKLSAGSVVNITESIEIFGIISNGSKVSTTPTNATYATVNLNTDLTITSSKKLTIDGGVRFVVSGSLTVEQGATLDLLGELIVNGTLTIAGTLNKLVPTQDGTSKTAYNRKVNVAKIEVASGGNMIVKAGGVVNGFATTTIVLSSATDGKTYTWYDIYGKVVFTCDYSGTEQSFEVTDGGILVNDGATLTIETGADFNDTATGEGTITGIE